MATRKHTHNTECRGSEDELIEDTWTANLTLNLQPQFGKVWRVQRAALNANENTCQQPTKGKIRVELMHGRKPQRHQWHNRKYTCKVTPSLPLQDSKKIVHTTIIVFYSTIVTCMTCCNQIKWILNQIQRLILTTSNDNSDKNDVAGLAKLDVEEKVWAVSGSQLDHCCISVPSYQHTCHRLIVLSCLAHVSQCLRLKSFSSVGSFRCFFKLMKYMC